MSCFQGQFISFTARTLKRWMYEEWNVQNIPLLSAIALLYGYRKLLQATLYQRQSKRGYEVIKESNLGPLETKGHTLTTRPYLLLYIDKTLQKYFREI